ncbi:hypothetical protein D3C85_1285000 [compost metagenome]
MGLGMNGFGQADRDRSHQHRRGGSRDHRAQRDRCAEQQGDLAVRAPGLRQAQQVLGGQVHTAGVFQRNRERQHADDENERAPVDGPIGNVQRDAAE